MNAILGEKVGMTQIFDDESRAIPVTVIKAGPCHVTQIRTQESDGYSAVQISYGEIAKKNVNKPTTGHFAKAGVEPARHLVELRVDDASGYELGQAGRSYNGVCVNHNEAAFKAAPNGVPTKSEIRKSTERCLRLRTAAPTARSRSVPPIDGWARISRTCRSCR